MPAPSLVHLTDTPFNLDVPCDFGRFKDAIIEIGYTPDTINTFVRMSPTERRHRLSSDTGINSLIRLFHFCEAISAERVCKVLEKWQIDPLVKVGILRRHGAAISASAALSWFDSDLLFVDSARGENQVMSVSASSASLARMTPRSKVANVLDVGTGSGVQAILAARHSNTVVATDISCRALNFAALNARLNGVDNIELRRGVFFEPVAEERFDLLVVNPPYVISPEFRFSYRDSGMKGDRVSESVVRAATDHLKDGGYAVTHVTWYHKSEEDWASRPIEWMRDLDCDTWWLRFKREDPLSYAMSWLDDAENENAASERLNQWLKYYDDLGIGMISFGSVIMRKRLKGLPWQRFEDFAGLECGFRCFPVGDQVDRIFAAEERMATIRSDYDLLDGRFCLESAHRLDETRIYKEQKWTSVVARLSSSCGFPLSAELDERELLFITNIDGKCTVREAIRSAADTLAMDVNALLPTLLALVAKLARDGLIRPC